jgi:hypothetical protein
MNGEPYARAGEEKANGDVGCEVANAIGGHFEQDLLEWYVHLGITARSLIHGQGNAIEILTYHPSC